MRDKPVPPGKEMKGYRGGKNPTANYGSLELWKKWNLHSMLPELMKSIWREVSTIGVRHHCLWRKTGTGCEKSKSNS
jgi:hypothetical protein